jgi:pyruvate formate lyase activating enzyme
LVSYGAPGTYDRRNTGLEMGKVFDIQKFSIHDGPGIRTTVFLKGCPLNCWWCHNPESQDLDMEMMFHAKRCIRCGACQSACTHGAISQNGDFVSTDEEACTLCGACVEACYAEAREIVGQEMTVAQVMAEIERDITFYDESGGGVTFSGGEPLLQRDFLGSLLMACKDREIHTTLDTCGFAAWETLDRIREFVDLFLYDIKLMDGAKHQEFTGAPNDLILKNLQMLSEQGHNVVLRLPIIPGVNDDEMNIRRTGEFVTNLLSLNQVDILPYHHTGTDKYSRLKRAYELSEIRPPSNDDVAKIAQILRGYGLQVRIGG